MSEETPPPELEQLPERFEEGAAAAEEVVRAAGATPERHHLLAGYDRIRRRVLAAVERRSGKLGSDAVRVLLLVPDIFLLLVRLVLDREVPAASRALIGSVLAYFLLPFDLLPEALLGGAGYLDDVVLATAVLAQAFSGELEPYARKHWSGPEDLRLVLQDVTDSAHRLMGSNLSGKLERLLARKGVAAEPTAGEPEGGEGGGRE